MKAHVLRFLTLALALIAALENSFLSSARADADAQATIRGTVVDEKGQPIEGATVSISTAGVRVGASCFCPSCYADCSKRAKSDTGGAFSIASLDPTLVFRVLFVAKGFEPKFVKVDPLKEASITVAMKARPKGPDNPRQIVSGQVVGPRGEPLVGALVEPFGCKWGERRWWGSLPGVDPLDVTDSQGRFQIIADKPADGFDLEVTSRALAKKRFALVPVAKTDNRLQLATGATVRGRIVDHGRPVAGVEVGLAQVSRKSETFLGAAVIGTDADGRFLFANVSANDDCFVYGIMDSLRSSGGIPAKHIHVGTDDSEADVGDLAVESAFRISGRIALSDGKPVPAHTRVLISREEAWDSQIVDADANGAFTAAGIPHGVVTISANIPNYHLSVKNKSLERLNWIFLKGLVEKDVEGLVVLFEPGKLVRPPYPRDPHAQQALTRSYERLKVEPPTGVTADLKAPEGTEPEIVEQFATELPAKPRKPLPKIDLPPPLPEPVLADADVPKRTVTGRVTDDAGKPIADAEVWLQVRWVPPTRSLSVHAKCEPNGQFKLAFPTAWLQGATVVDVNGAIWAYAPGHRIGLANGGPLILGEPDAKPCEIHLGPVTVTSVTIHRPDGSAAVGALVAPSIYQQPGAGSWGFDVPELRAKTMSATDRDGRAKLPFFALEQIYDLEVVADNLGKQVFSPSYFVNGKKILRTEFTLQAPGRLEGRVVSEQPELFRSMFISIDTDDPSSQRGECKGVVTVTPDADGRFVIPTIVPGWVQLYARLADERIPVRPRLIGYHQLEVAPGRTTRLEIPLEAARKVTGLVRVKGTGEPVKGALVAACFGEVAQSDKATTDSKGRYSAMVLPGPLRLQVIYTGRKDLIQAGEPWLARIPVPEGTSDFELPPVELSKTKTVIGRLLDHDGKPLAEHRVNGLVGNRRYGWGRSNDTGGFTLDGVPEEVQLERYQAYADPSPIPRDVKVVTLDPLVIQLK